MTARPVVEAWPGYAEEAVRRERFEQAHPDAAIRRCWRSWTGSIIVCRTRRQAIRPDLGQLLDALDVLAVMAADAAAIERDYPGWRVWLSSVDRWWAVRQGPDGVWTQGKHDPITLSADDADGLRGQLADAAERASAAS